MIGSKRNRTVFGFLGITLFLFFMCGSSVKETHKEQAYTSEKEIDNKLESIEKSTEMQTGTEQTKPIAISSEQFVKLVSDYRKEWKYVGKKPCVVDFYADWCRPCKMMEPAFAKMAEKYAGKIDFYKVNVDYNQAISAAYQITNIPMLFFCSLDGKLTRVVGYQTEEQIEANLLLILSK